MRKIRATLLKPGNNLGYVKVAVHAYTYLLARSADEISSYGPDFFSKELLAGQDAVVRGCCVLCVVGLRLVARTQHTAQAETLPNLCAALLANLQIPLLLRDMHIEMRTLGAELLAVFTEVQTQADCKLDAIQAHTPQVRQRCVDRRVQPHHPLC
jgi:hypothetical protein